eukprot:Phypoly_transcript_10953.p1 GENE.Phypoly_transcript_10953~~Phypoly_transcript_10953.p1  ORF type:complete len:254 (+),score=30.66 Phypoly_transcript_10953:48-764(+)
MATAKTISTKPALPATKLPSMGEKGVVSTLLQLFSTLLRKNEVQVALQAESAIFDSMMEELKASRITPPQPQPTEPSTPVLVTKIDAQGQISTTPIVPNPNLSKFHVILDIDGTLVQTVAQHEGMIFGEPDYEDFELHLCSYKRPGLDKFINFCFTHFQSVSLWTAGTQEYAEFIARSIAPKGYQFMFVLSRVHCKDHPVHEGSLVKDMNGMPSRLLFINVCLQLHFTRTPYTCMYLT